MVFFITFLRALAACLITNAHYTGIYPTDIIANGGLIGDVLFFAISGYCLYNVKLSFVKWYAKRIYRVYVPVFVITLIYMVLGLYTCSENNLIWWFLYPTNYHFVASIIVLYIPYYFIVKFDATKKHIPLLMAIIASVYIIIYFTIYDRTYYHIDAVKEPMIRFLFMESMLLGAVFKQKENKIRNVFKLRYALVTILMFLIYFVSKIIFSHRTNLSHFQFLNQIAIFTLLFFMFRTFAGLDGKLETMPHWIKKVISFVSSITLEIYLVQYVIIGYLRTIGYFPLNWIIITTAIVIVAYILHRICYGIYSLGECFSKKWREKG